MNKRVVSYKSNPAKFQFDTFIELFPSSFTAHLPLKKTRRTDEEGEKILRFGQSGSIELADWLMAKHDSSEWLEQTSKHLWLGQLAPSAKLKYGSNKHRFFWNLNKP